MNKMIKGVTLLGMMNHAKKENIDIDEIHVNSRIVEVLVTYKNSDKIKRLYIKRENDDQEIFSNETLNKFIEETKED